MKIYILLLFGTCLFINTSESPLNSVGSNNKHFVNNFSFNSRNDKRYEYNEEQLRNHRQFGRNSQNLHPSEIQNDGFQVNINHGQLNDYDKEPLRNHQQFEGSSQNALKSSQKLNDSFHVNDNHDQPISQSPPVPATLELPNAQNSFLQSSFSINEDKIFFPDEENDKLLENYTTAEKFCFSQQRVYFNETCAELLKFDYCPQGEWLVLDMKSILRTPPKVQPKCEKPICKSTEFYWAENKRCYKNEITEHEHFCPPGNTINNDYFGYGKCECKPQYGLYSNGMCYGLYTQGPCEKGYLFVQKNGTLTCSINPCKNSSLVLYKHNGQCYKLGTQGPCKPNSKFEVTTQKVPDCSQVTVVSLNVIGTPHLCVTDKEKNCQPQFKVEDTKDYINRIISDANKRKGKDNGK